jgi:hypothetical protein
MISSGILDQLLLNKYVVGVRHGMCPCVIILRTQQLMNMVIWVMLPRNIEEIRSFGGAYCRYYPSPRVS